MDSHQWQVAIIMDKFIKSINFKYLAEDFFCSTLEKNLNFYVLVDIELLSKADGINGFLVANHCRRQGMELETF